ncbi:MAG: ATP-binding protein [Nitrospinae bacterium]|nr:ATP-binding protein [Nitrospinota bacterium]
MLLRFGVANHHSIRDAQELSLSASSLKERQEKLIDCAAVPSGAVLPVVVIYGANASGKSNLIDAISTMRSMVLRSQTKGEPGGGVPRSPFKLDDDSPQLPSHFDIDFLIDGVRYHYGFEASDTAFESEWLYAFPKSHRQMLFERTGEEFRFGRGLKGQNRVIARLTRPNSLFLSAAAQNDHEQLLEVFGYFRSLHVIRSIAVHEQTVSERLAEEELDRRVIDFLGKIDTGIIDYQQKESDLPEEILEMQQELFALFAKRANVEPPEVKEKHVTIELAHRGRGGEPFYLELDSESAGTRRLLLVLDLAFRALDEGAPLFIDELDASLHTQAAEAVLKLFCSRETNPKGAQLIATTHDTNLLDSPLLRRDEVWFTQKDLDGATQLYPLTDIRTRKSDNIEKGYLQGRYGAVPFNDPISALGSNLGASN